MALGATGIAPEAVTPHDHGRAGDGRNTFLSFPIDKYPALGYCVNMNSKPNYQKIDAEAFAARDAAEATAAADGWTGWDCTKRGKEAAQKVWRAAGVSSPAYRDPIPDDGLDTLDIDALDN